MTAQVNRTLAPRASARVEIRDGRAVLIVRGLPAPRAGRVYEVWLQRPGGAVVPTSALFSPRTDGSATTSVAVSDARQVLVSSEPRGGSLQPTTTPVLSARVS